MRARLLWCLAFLCGAEIAHAQQWPAYPATGNFPGYAPTYQGVPNAAGYPYPSGGAPMPYYNTPSMNAYGAPYNPAMNSYPGYPAYNYSTNYPQYTIPPYGQAGTGYPNPPQAPFVAPPPGSLTGMASDKDTPPSAVPIAPPGPGTGKPTKPLTELVDDDGVQAPPREPEAAPARPQVFWISANYTLSFFRTGVQPGPLVTTGSAADAVPGALGSPNTTVLFGNNVSFNPFSGVRLDAGVFLDRDSRWSLDWNGLLITPNHTHFSAASDAAGNPVLARPVFDTVTGTPTSYIDARPGVAAGGVAIDTKALLIGTELNLQYRTDPLARLQAGALAGFRFLNLSESLSIQDNLAPLTANALTFQGAFVNAPSSLSDQDRFRTRNYFYGPQLGGQMSWQEQWFLVNAFGKVGLGVTQQDVNINGSTTLITPTGNTTVPGGILAQTTNSGRFSRDVFGVVPEFGLNVGIQANQYVRLMVGYSFLLWNSVVRPGAQIDPAVNTGLVPSDRAFGTPGGPTRPAFSFRDELFWVQTFSVGVQVTY